MRPGCGAVPAGRGESADGARRESAALRSSPLHMVNTHGASPVKDDKSKKGSLHITRS